MIKYVFLFRSFLRYCALATALTNNNDFEMVKHLVTTYNADINLTDGGMKSLLSIAVANLDERAVKFLVVEMKADINIKVREHSKMTSRKLLLPLFALLSQKVLLFPILA